MSKSILGLTFALFFTLHARAEQPIFNIGSTNANNGEIIEINFNVDDFTNIFSAQFSVNWNLDVLEFRAVKNLNPGVTGLSSANFNLDSVLTDGNFAIQWFEAGLNPITLPAGSLFFTVEFEVVGSPCQSSPVAITGNPTEIEVSDDGVSNIGLVTNNGTVTVPGTSCTENITFIGNSVSGTCGSEACIQFTVQNFTTVGSMEFSLVYNPSVLQFDRFQNFGPLQAFGEGNTNLLSPGTIRVIWFNGNAENDTLPDGTVLFEICFDVIGSGGQSSEITFGNNPSVMISDIDGNFHTVNIEPAVITAQCQLEGFALIADSACTEPGGLVCIDISVNDFVDMLALQFSMNWDSTRFKFDHLEGFSLTGLDMDGFGTPGFPDVTEGQLTLSWFDPNLVGVTLPDTTTIFTLCLRAVGSAGTSTPVTFSGVPLEIELATVDSTLTTYALIPGHAQIQTDCSNPPCTFSYTLQLTHPGCPGQSNGSINLSVDTGNCPGTPTYQWSHNNLTTQDISSLPAGPYTVTITLGNQIVVASDTLVDPLSMGVNGIITPPAPPTSSTGAINIMVTGGTPPYTYQWNTNPVTTTEDLSNIPVGTYIVTVTDSRGCTFIPDPFIVGADATAVIIGTCPGVCQGSITVNPSFGVPPYTYVWNTTPPQTTQTISNLCAGTYCVTITDSESSTVDTCFIVPQTPALVVNATITHDVNENGQGIIDLSVSGGSPPYTYLWSTTATTPDIFNLSQGEYCVTITHGVGCTYVECFDVFAGGIGLSLMVTQYGDFQTSCNNRCDGEIFSSVSGGTPPYSYLWSNNATTPDLTNLCPGIYSLTVTDATGNTASLSRTIVAPSALTITTIETNPSDITASDGAISIIANGGVPNYTYDWFAGNVASQNNLPSGTYPITVIDANGCEVQYFATLIPDDIVCYQANTIITPNSDGKNDFFFIACIFDADNHLFIFNRHGGLVYDTQNYTNNWTGVDGDNQPLPDGGYMWVLETFHPDGTPRILKGTVNILRTAD